MYGSASGSMHLTEVDLDASDIATDSHDSSRNLSFQLRSTSQLKGNLTWCQLRFLNFLKNNSNSSAYNLQG